MAILSATPEHLAAVSTILKKGGVGAIPTETVYGLAADARNPLAVARIFEIKNRPVFNPLIVHLSVADDIFSISTIPERKINNLLSTFWPGPLTVVVPKKDVIPEITTGGRPTVAVRLPDHAIARTVIGLAGCPIAAPSANPSNYLSPTQANHVENQLGEMVDFILDGGPCRVGVESTIISLTGDIPLLLRHGGLSTDELKAVLPDLVERTEHSHNPEAPGQLKVHYSPRTPLRFWKGEPLTGKSTGFLSWSFIPADPDVCTFFHSENQNLREAAARLFTNLHEMDQSGLDIIYVEPVPETGLGKAIMDRLNRAVAGHPDS